VFQIWQKNKKRGRKEKKLYTSFLAEIRIASWPTSCLSWFSLVCEFQFMEFFPGLRRVLAGKETMQKKDRNIELRRQVFRPSSYITAQGSIRASRGSAMLLALFLVFITGFMMVPILQRAVHHHNNAFRENRWLKAFHLAEAGVEEALWHLSYDEEEVWNTWNTSNTETYSKPQDVLLSTDGHEVGEYQVTIDGPIPLQTSVTLGPAGGLLPFPVNSQSEPVITATAGVPDIDTLGSQVRVIQVRARARTTFSLGLFSNTDLEFDGQPYVNSFDSRLGPYDPVTNAFNNIDVGANDNILLSGEPIVDGDAAMGGSVVQTGDSGKITGDVEGGLTEIVLPSLSEAVAAAKLENNNDEIPLARKLDGREVAAFDPATNSIRLNAEATLTLSGGTKENPKIYYFSEAVLNGGSKIETNGYVMIFTDGNLDFNGGTIVNNGGSGTAEQMQIYSSGGPETDILINGGAGFTSAVYAPSAEVTLTGGGNFFGALVGGGVNVSGDGQFHYDEALGDTGQIAFFEVNEWVEKAAPL
jgi:hypothetical protein